MKVKEFIKKGGLLVLALLLANDAWGFAAIIRVHKTAVLAGGDTVSVFSGVKPNQTSAATLVEGTNYSIDDTSDATFRIYNLYDTPTQPAYLLILRGTTYAILGPAAMGSTVPVTTTYSSAPTFYTMGPPVAPTIGTITTGYETALINLSYSSAYEYAGVDLQVASDAGFASLLAATGPVTTTSLSGQPADYKIGELVDGRVLTTDSDGVTYYFRILGKVDGVTDSAWADQSFATLGLGAAGPQSFILTLESQVGAATPGPGINAFGLPFGPDAGGRWWVAAANGSSLVPPLATSEVTTALGLVRAINAAAGSNVVSTFGRWNRATQQLAGVMIDYSSAALNDIFSGDATALGGISLAEGEGYQVYVTTNVSLTIRNTP